MGHFEFFWQKTLTACYVRQKATAVASQISSLSCLMHFKIYPKIKMRNAYFSSFEHFCTFFKNWVYPKASILTENRRVKRVIWAFWTTAFSSFTEYAKITILRSPTLVSTDRGDAYPANTRTKRHTTSATGSILTTAKRTQHCDAPTTRTYMTRNHTD